MSEATTNFRSDCGGEGDKALAFLVLRGWLALRALATGFEKFSAFRTEQRPLIDPTTGMVDPSGAMVEVKVKFYALTNYSGIPAALKDKLANEPLLPQGLMAVFNGLLGPALIVSGLMLLFGLGTRLSLVAQGVIYIALTWGLILIKQDDGVAWLGIHVGLIALALALAKYNRVAVFKKW
jgi:thiosulfate dehydrogenase [quinone] large subunit